MKASKFSEAQIAFVLKQAEDGTAVAEVCRKAGISEATFYNWRKKYAGLMPSEMKRLRQLEDENAKLKRIVADLSLDKAMLQDVCQKMYDPPRLCKAQVRSDDSVCITVSGLSRVGCCCSQAMMRSARAVLNNCFGHEPALLHRAYGAPMDRLVITLPNLAVCCGRPGCCRTAPLVGGA